jgi:hypothetical protein
MIVVAIGILALLWMCLRQTTIKFWALMCQIWSKLQGWGRATRDEILPKIWERICGMGKRIQARGRTAKEAVVRRWKAVFVKPLEERKARKEKEEEELERERKANPGELTESQWPPV